MELVRLFGTLMTASLRGVLILLASSLLLPLGAAAQTPAEPFPATSRWHPQEAAPADSVLQARLRGVFGEIEAFQDVRVTVRNRVAHLEGAVVQPQEATEAEALARQFEGVLYVTSDLTAESDLADRVIPAVDRLEKYARGLLDFLPVGGLALIVLLFTFGLSRWIGAWEAPRALRLSPLAWGLVRRVVQGGVVLVGLVIAFDLFGVTSLVGALLGTAGVAGLAIGFAFRDIIENYLAGVLLSLRQPFRVNDVVSIADHEGRVVRLTARELVLLTFDGNHVRLPNATVFKSVLVNYTLNPRRLFFFDVGIGVAEDLADAQRVGVETLDAMNGVMEDPTPFARVRELGDSSVVVRYHGWVNQNDADFFKVQSEALRLVKQALDDEGIEMPEPTYRLHLYQAEDLPEEGAVTPAASAVEQAAAIDVVPDGELEAQVEEELRTSDEPNFLSE